MVVGKLYDWFVHIAHFDDLAKLNGGFFTPIFDDPTAQYFIGSGAYFKTGIHIGRTESARRINGDVINFPFVIDHIRVATHIGVDVSVFVLFRVVVSGAGIDAYTIRQLDGGQWSAKQGDELWVSILIALGIAGKKQAANDNSVAVVVVINGVDKTANLQYSFVAIVLEGSNPKTVGTA